MLTRIASAITIVLAFALTALPVPYPFDLEQLKDTSAARTGNPPTAAASPDSIGDVLCNIGTVYVSDTAGESGSDIWGWEAPDGQEYAIMGFFGGIAFVNTSGMKVVARVDDECGGGGSWRDVKTYQNYCYAVTECSGSGRGVLIIDMSGLPNSVRVVRQYATTNFSDWHNIAIDTTRGFAYLASQNNGFLVLDLADPENPVNLGFVNTGGCHDLFVDNDTAWVAESFSPFWSVWDMTNKAAPVRIAHVSIPSAGFVHQIWTNSDRTVTVTTEEAANKTVKFWDISNLSNIQLVGEYLGPSNLAHNAFIKGDTVYISHYESGVAVVDITDPSNPVEIDRFDTWPQAENPGFAGCWGVFPYTSSGKVYASNFTDGNLFVFGDIGLTADTTFGPVPLTVQFSGATCGIITSWDWAFGDGGTDSVPSPVHTYSEAGLYTVDLNVMTDTGLKSLSSAGLIAVYAESLTVANVVGSPLEKVRIDIFAANHIPVLGFRIPLEWGGPLFLVIDSVSTFGLRTEYMGTPILESIDGANKQAVYRIQSVTRLDPGNGPVMSVYAQLPPFTISTPNPIEVDGYGTQLPEIFFAQFNITPTALNGSVSMGCCVGIAGNVDDDAGELVDIGDLTRLISFLFISNDPLACEDEGNVDGIGGVDIGDVTRLIDFLFITGTSPASCP